MPQIQFLDAPPSFGNQLGQALGQGLGTGINQGISTSLNQMLENKKNKGKITALQGLGLDVPNDFFSLPEDIQKTLIQDKIFNKFNSQSQTQSPDLINNQDQKVGFEGMSEPQLLAGLSNPIYGKAAQAELDKRREVQKDVRKSDIKRSDKYLEDIEQKRQSTQRSKSALISAEEALKNGNFGFFSKDNLSRIPGLEGLASKNAAVFSAAAKTFFLSDLERTMGRPNQFLEKVLKSAIFDVGKSNEANQTLVEFYKNAVDLEEERIKISDELEDYYREKIGYVPGNIGRLVDRQLKPYAEAKEKELTELFKKEESISKNKDQPEIYATNPETGERIKFENGKWKKVKK